MSGLCYFKSDENLFRSSITDQFPIDAATPSVHVKVANPTFKLQQQT